MKALITGNGGFVGGYLRRELESNGYTVTGLDVMPGEGSFTADLLDTVQVSHVVEQVRPDAVFHLAGQADVGKSWNIPQITLSVNIIGAVNLMEAVRAVCPAARMVLVGSSDQYGDLGEDGRSVDETLVMNPQTPYAVSKKAQEEIARIYVRTYGLHICMTRSFNHGGAGQRLGFLIPDFASGIVRVERGESDKLMVGNLTARRDFTHVKDVVQAYRLIAEKGRAGEVYNIGSGQTHSAQEILDGLLVLASCPIVVEQDIGKMRPSDTPVICCDHSKLTKDTGWEPEHSLECILQETLEYFRKQ